MTISDDCATALSEVVVAKAVSRKIANSTVFDLLIGLAYGK
jgi:hypothetical protein